MKNFISLLFVCFITLFVSAQEINEPSYIGDCLLVKSDKSNELLEKSIAQMKVKNKFVVVTTSYVMPGCCSKTEISKFDKVQFIVKNSDNNIDPISVIKVVKFNKKKKNREALLRTTTAIGSSSAKEQDGTAFTAEKYGEKSYLVTLDQLVVGEYGISVLNSSTFATFSVVD